MAAGKNEGGHYFFPHVVVVVVLGGTLLPFTPEGIVVGF